MDLKEMYEEFRDHYPELTQVADVKHMEVWGSVGHETMFTWFESLASALNDRMGMPEHRKELASVFSYFDMRYRTDSENVKNCIDVSLVENLFWQVTQRNADPIWEMLPKNLQQLYVDFHGTSPT